MIEDGKSVRPNFEGEINPQSVTTFINPDLQSCVGRTGEPSIAVPSMNVDTNGDRAGLLNEIEENQHSISNAQSEIIDNSVFVIVQATNKEFTVFSESVQANVRVTCYK